MVQQGDVTVRWLKGYYAILVSITCLVGVIVFSSSFSPPPAALGAGPADARANKLEDKLVAATPQDDNTAATTMDHKALTTYTTNKRTQTSRYSNRTGLEQLPWASVYGKGEKDSYHFFSAYYDDRVSAPERPTVLVMGYSYKSVKHLAFYCLFKYLNGKKVCRNTPTTDRHPGSCFSPSLGAKPRHYLCSMKTGEEPPVSVQLSTSSGCEPQFTSGEIPVQNRKPAQSTKKFGICVGGPLVQESRNILNDLIQFIEMSRLLGAELIVFYASEAQIDKDILEYLWTHYPDTVRTIGWKKFNKWSPLHYYGQLLIISDCYYRVMYEVENLAMIDLDEMIIPVKHNNWNEMVQEFKAPKDVSSFKFQNAFFDDPDPSASKNLQVKLQSTNPSFFIPKYFTHTRRHKCFPGHQYRVKLMSKPRFIVEPSIHSICKRIASHPNYNVPPELGILAHYRTAVPDDCKKKPTFTDHLALKFKEKLNKILFG